MLLFMFTKAVCSIFGYACYVYKFMQMYVNLCKCMCGHRGCWTCCPCSCRRRLMLMVLSLMPGGSPSLTSCPPWGTSSLVPTSKPCPTLSDRPALHLATVASSHMTLHPSNLWTLWCQRDEFACSWFRPMKLCHMSYLSNKALDVFSFVFLLKVN